MLAAITTDVQIAARILRDGGLVAFATETVYGLGADATNPLAVARIFEAKDRPLFDPLIVHIADPEDVHKVCSSVPPIAQLLIDTFWPGPMTLVLPRQSQIPPIVTAGLDNVGVRLPAHPLARELIRAAEVPLAAPSANLFGRVSPTCMEHVLDQLGDRIECVLDGGPCRVGIESTVLRLTHEGHTLLLRPGGVTREHIEAVIGPIEVPDPLHSPSGGNVPQAAPGMLEQHYAPSKPLMIAESLSDIAPSPDTGVLSFRGFPEMHRFPVVEVLSPEGSLPVAAAQLFAALHRLERAEITRIVAERCPDEGLGRAMNDRLQRAAARK